LLGIEEEFYEAGEPVVLNLKKETEVQVITKISRPETSSYYDATKLTLYQDFTNNIIDVASMYGGPGSVIEQNGLTLTINYDGTATITGTAPETVLFNAVTPSSKPIFPPGVYHVPYDRLMLSGFAVNGGNFGGNRWGNNKHTIVDPFVLYRIFLNFSANKEWNETFPINIPILNLPCESDNINSNRITYTVDFGRAVTSGEYNWTTGELKDENGNTITFYEK
jgi:hypothetical protein